MGLKQAECFEYNLPVQAYRNEEDGAINVINYMPRKNRCDEISLDELKPEGMSERDYFHGVALNLLNLAILFVEFAEKKRDAVHYHDEDLERHFYCGTFINNLESHGIEVTPPTAGKGGLMPDITMCQPSQPCSLKHMCYRHEAIASAHQSWSDFSNEDREKCFIKIVKGQKATVPTVSQNS